MIFREMKQISSFFLSSISRNAELIFMIAVKNARMPQASSGLFPARCNEVARWMKTAHASPVRLVARYRPAGRMGIA